MYNDQVKELPLENQSPADRISIRKQLTHSCALYIFGTDIKSFILNNGTVMKHLLSTVLFVLLIQLSVLGFSVDTVVIRSQSMNIDKKAVVILPDSYKSMPALPVLYLLHGHGGIYSDWVTRAPGVKDLADQYNVIIVCPDGGNNWYFDSPVNNSVRYETYISGEVVNYIDRNYKSIKSAKGRAIAGLSMGGHGALYLAVRHQDVFGSAGSMSGGVDIRPFPRNWDIPSVLGNFSDNSSNWENNTVINVIDKLPAGALNIIIDCGVDDFFISVNRSLHDKLVQKQIAHTYMERPGAHTWKYWAESVRYMMLFFSEHLSAG